ncbi:putative receptor like protein 25 [Corylus avellana]|uniref:putative receptor like protein 25 n=1 Tax=Corylus avellana TaxID=13451 RepID=UPI00286B4768|nr:putative receptor like protein 25 [Corylus avellana]
MGNNLIEDVFPCYLKNSSMLRALVLRSNNFSRPVACLDPNATWPMLQIVDIASNNFTGKIPKISAWKAMMDTENRAQFEFLCFRHLYYQDSIILTSKGRNMELVKILTIFTSIDFSCNNLEGPVPKELGGLRSLYVLNLLHNALTGQIPPSLANLTQLESLDLSRNKLTGEIPVQLAAGLIFLSVLNLSFNQFVGPIPMIKQFATFSEASYAGNKGLCGFPLKAKCTHAKPISPPTFKESPSNSENVIDWNFISVELGFVFGFGIVIWSFMFLKRWRIWYSRHIDDILFRIFPQLYLRKKISLKMNAQKSREEALVIVYEK